MIQNIKSLNYEELIFESLTAYKNILFLLFLIYFNADYLKSYNL
jgi:hypothetical protein